MGFIYPVMLFVLFIAMIASGAQETEMLDLESYVAKALELDTDFLSSKIDVDLANIKHKSSASLYKGIFSTAPFSRSYKVVEPNSYSTSSFEEMGLRFGYTQFLPTGTQLNVRSDQYSENTRSDTFAKNSGYSFGITQPLLKNYFGVSDQLNSDYFLNALEATVQKSLLVKREACAKAIGNFVDAWVSFEKKKFNDELLALADELLKKSERSKRSGQIGQLDWLGVQSEYLNQKSLAEQYTQVLAEAILKLRNQVPSLRNPKLVDPSNIFGNVVGRIDINSLSESNLQIDQLAASIKALQYKLGSEEKNSLPDLDLTVEKSTASGSLASEKYRDDDLTLGLNLTWKLNDDSVAAQSNATKLELKKLKYEYDEMFRNRKGTIETKYKDVLSKEQQIKYERERSLILSQITEENKKRFLQGRIEFQDFLRIKEQLMINKNIYLDKQAQMWKSLTSFAIAENVALPICVGAR